MKIHIVVGASGEHEQYTEWPVAAYEDEFLATKHRDAASSMAKRIIADQLRAKPPGDYADNKFDPDMQILSGCVTYEIIDINAVTSDSPEAAKWSDILSQRELPDER